MKIIRRKLRYLHHRSTTYCESSTREINPRDRKSLSAVQSHYNISHKTQRFCEQKRDWRWTLLSTPFTSIIYLAQYISDGDAPPALKLQRRVPVAAIWKLLRVCRTTRRGRYSRYVPNQPASALESAREDPQPVVVESSVPAQTAMCRSLAEQTSVFE